MLVSRRSIKELEVGWSAVLHYTCHCASVGNSLIDDALRRSSQCKILVNARFDCALAARASSSESFAHWWKERILYYSTTGRKDAMHRGPACGLSRVMCVTLLLSSNGKYVPSCWRRPLYNIGSRKQHPKLKRTRFNDIVECCWMVRAWLHLYIAPMV